MRALDNPAAGPRVGRRPPGLRSGPALRDVRDVPARANGGVRWLAAVPLVGTEVLAAARAGPRAGDDDGVERRREEDGVMPMGAAHDEGQRDSTRVDEQTALGPLFSPGPSGSAPRLPTPGAP